MTIAIILTVAIVGTCVLLLWGLRETPPSTLPQARARAAEAGGFASIPQLAMTVSAPPPPPAPVAPPKRNSKGKRGQSKRAKRARGAK